MEESILKTLEDNFSETYWIKIYNNNEFPHDFFYFLGSHKLFGYIVSKENNGLGKSLAELTQLVYEVSKISGFATYLLLAQNLVAKMCEENCHNDIKKELLSKIIRGENKISLALTEEECGNDALCIKSSALEINGSFLLNGKKDYVTNADLVDYIIIAARTSYDENKRSYGITLFLTDIEKLRKNGRLIKLHKMGLDFLSLYTIYFNDLKIDKKYILGEQNKGWNIIVKYFNWDKLLLAAMFVGIGEKALDIAIKYSKQRKVFDKIIGSYQGIQFPLAEAHINLVAAKALINQAKEYPDDIDLVFSAYYTALNAASQAIDTSLQVLGAKGYLKNSLIEKFYRDIRYYKIGPLSKELLLANIAYRVLGLPKSY